MYVPENLDVTESLNLSDSGDRESHIVKRDSVLLNIIYADIVSIRYMYNNF